MEKIKQFFKRKDIVFSAKRYGIDALGAMAQGLFCSLLIGTIVKTLGQQLALQFLINVGDFASSMSGAAMAVAIGYALKADPMVLFSLAAVGWAANAEGKAGVRLTAEPSATFVWNEECKVFTAEVAGAPRYLGTYNTYNTMYVTPNEETVKKLRVK